MHHGVWRRRRGSPEQGFKWLAVANDTGLFTRSVQQRLGQARQASLSRRADGWRSSAIRDADRTRRKILDAARREFGMHGLQGARVEAIARRARVNKGLIFYYFQSKEELFRVLSEERIASTLPAHDRDVEDGPFDWPLRLFETREETLDWVRYFVWEGINLDSAAPTELPQAELRRASFRAGGRRGTPPSGHRRAPRAPGSRTADLLSLCPRRLPLPVTQMAFLITGHLPDDAEFRANYKRFLKDLADLFEL